MTNNNQSILSHSLSVTEKGGLEEYGESVFMKEWKPMDVEDGSDSFVGKVVVALIFFIAICLR